MSFDSDTGTLQGRWFKIDKKIKKRIKAKYHKIKDWVMDPKLKVKDILKKIDSKSLKIKDFVRIKIGE